MNTKRMKPTTLKIWNEKTYFFLKLLSLEEYYYEYPNEVISGEITKDEALESLDNYYPVLWTHNKIWFFDNWKKTNFSVAFDYNDYEWFLNVLKWKQEIAESVEPYLSLTNLKNNKFLFSIDVTGAKEFMFWDEKNFQKMEIQLDEKQLKDAIDWLEKMMKTIQNERENILKEIKKITMWKLEDILNYQGIIKDWLSLEKHIEISLDYEKNITISHPWLKRSITIMSSFENKKDFEKRVVSFIAEFLNITYQLSKSDKSFNYLKKHLEELESSAYWSSEEEYNKIEETIYKENKELIDTIYEIYKSVFDKKVMKKIFSDHHKEKDLHMRIILDWNKYAFLHEWYVRDIVEIWEDRYEVKKSFLERLKKENEEVILNSD